MTSRFFGLWGSFTAAPASSYAFTNAEAESLVARMSSAPDDARKEAIDVFVGALKTAGVWNKTDVLLVLSAHDSQAALLNWISTSYNATANGAVAFTADRGYVGAVAGDYLSVAYDPDSLAGINFVETVGDGTVQSQHLGVYVLTANANAGSDMACGTAFRLSATSTGSGLAPTGRLASTANVIIIPDGDAPHHAVVTRNGANSAFGYRNGVAAAEQVSSSSSATTSPLAICAISSGGAPTERQVAIAHAGGKLTAGEVADFYTAANTYLTAVGAV